jgi:hypothetical protein
MMTIDDGDVAKTMAIADHKATRAIPPQIVSGIDASACSSS